MGLKSLGEVLGNLQLVGWRLYFVHYVDLLGVAKAFSDLGNMSPRMRALAASQDEIGWHHFMEGRISHHFYAIQQLYLSHSPSVLNGGEWMRDAQIYLRSSTRHAFTVDLQEFHAS